MAHLYGALSLLLSLRSSPHKTFGNLDELRLGLGLLCDLADEVVQPGPRDFLLAGQELELQEVLDGQAGGLGFGMAACQLLHTVFAQWLGVVLDEFECICCQAILRLQGGIEHFDRVLGHNPIGYRIILAAIPSPVHLPHDVGDGFGLIIPSFLLPLNAVGLVAAHLPANNRLLVAPKLSTLGILGLEDLAVLIGLIHGSLIALEVLPQEQGLRQAFVLLLAVPLVIGREGLLENRVGRVEIKPSITPPLEYGIDHRSLMFPFGSSSRHLVVKGKQVIGDLLLIRHLRPLLSFAFISLATVLVGIRRRGHGCCRSLAHLRGHCTREATGANEGSYIQKWFRQRSPSGMCI